jgi:hypothetical protein
VTVTVLICAGTEEPESKKEIIVYPNPSSGGITIENIPGDCKKISILDPQGKIIFEKNRNFSSRHLRTNGIVPGTYLIVIETEKNRITKQIIITP